MFTYRVCSCILVIAFTFQFESITCQLQTTNGTWVQIGTDIDGERGGDLSGGAIAMSADGATIAIGAERNNEGGLSSGHARVYELILNSSSLRRDQWSQLGSDINGDAGFYGFGHALATSADGSMIVIGAPYARGPTRLPGDDAIGIVRVLKFNITSKRWDQIGNDIKGHRGGDEFGTSVAMSANGKVIAIGGYGNDGKFSSGLAGHVRVYQQPVNLTSNHWEQLGSNIDGETAEDLSGISIATSADGTTIVVGAPGNENRNGQVRVHKYSSVSKQWGQVGQDLNGKKQNPRSEYEDGKYFGRWVTISADGTMIAVTSTSGFIANLHVQVYKYSTATSRWQQVGFDIDDLVGDSILGEGCSIDMSADGKTIAIGSAASYGTTGYYLGHVRVFTYHGRSWEQVGSNITGEAYNDRSGTSVAISADGTVVAVGAPNSGGDGSDRAFRSGHVRVYNFVPTTTKNCPISWNLYNSVTNAMVAPLINGTVINNPPLCNRTNIEAVVPCANNTVTLELYSGNGATLVHRRKERRAKFFLFGNNGTDVYNGRIPAGTYMIRAMVNGTVISPFTKFTLGGTCA